MRQGNFGKKLTKGQVHTAQSLYREGWSLQRIADHYSVSKQAIWKLFRRRGITMARSRTRRNALGWYDGSDPGTRTSTNRIERDEAGCICSFVELRTGATYSKHFPGLVRDAVIAMAEWCDRTPGDWRLRSYSTPLTIARDLQGQRADVDAGERVSHTTSASSTPRTNGSPEAHACGLIGRRDLLHPVLDR